MELFGEKKNPEEKQREKLQKFIERYQLQEIDEEDQFEIYQAVQSAKGNYLSTLVEQNFIMIKQLNRLNKNIQELMNK